MYMRGQARAVKVQNEDENQSQLVTTAEITKLRQVVQQQAELMQKQAEEAKEREKELTCRQNNLFEALMQRFLVHQGEDRAGPTTEQGEPKVREQPPQPQQGPRVGVDRQPQL